MLSRWDGYERAVQRKDKKEMKEGRAERINLKKNELGEVTRRGMSFG